MLLGLAILASPAHTEHNEGKARGTAGAFVLDDDEDDGERAGSEHERSDDDEDDDGEEGSGPDDDDDGGRQGAGGQPAQPVPPPAPTGPPPSGEHDGDDDRGERGEGHRRNGHRREGHEPRSHRPDRSEGPQRRDGADARPPPAPTQDEGDRFDDEVETDAPEEPPAPPTDGSDGGAGGDGTAAPGGGEPAGQGALVGPPAPAPGTGTPGSAFVPPGLRGPLPGRPGSQEGGSERGSAPGRQPSERGGSRGEAPAPATPGPAGELGGTVPASGALASASGAPGASPPAGAGAGSDGDGEEGPRSGRSLFSSVVAAADATRPPVGDSTPAVRIIREIPTEYRIALIALAFIALLLLGIAIRAWRRSVRAERVALVDALTGVANRQAFERQLAAEWTRAERYRRNLGLLLLDIDGLKQINDDRGHAAGDQALRRAATSIAARVRESDTVARIGGDEFVVICPETPTPGLKKLAGALEEDFEHLPVGVSVGFAQRVAGDKSPSDLLDRADTAMYRNKRSRTGLFARTGS